MPCLRLTTPEGWLEGRTEELFDRIDAVLCSVLKVPADDSLISLNRYAPDSIRLPARSGRRYIFIEVSLFAGRSPETRQALYGGLTRAMVELGAEAKDVIVALHDVALDDWGIGGRPGGAIVYDFPIEI